VYAFYSDRFVLPLPPGHRFPMEKYRLLRERVGAELPSVDLREPVALPDSVIALAHDSDYIHRLVHGDLSRNEIQKIGFPWSAQMVERSRRSAGATVEACRAAIRDGAAVNLAGGTHHAYANRGEGFCCFNDAIIAARVVQREFGGREGIRRIAVVDLDVHQGNGSAKIAENDESIFTLSVHGASNYPFIKECSDLDVELPDGTTDEVYLTALERALDQMSKSFCADFVIYLAGADPFVGDRLGRLGLTKAGLRARDERVFSYARAQGVPVAVAMAGGYARDIKETVDIHFNTVNCALQYCDS